MISFIESVVYSSTIVFVQVTSSGLRALHVSKDTELTKGEHVQREDFVTG